MKTISPFWSFFLLVTIQAQNPISIQQRAVAGDSQAMYELGILYREGNGVPKDKLTSFKWLWNAAQKGHPDAQYSVGYYYVRGEAVDQSSTVGAEWVMKAAQQGHAYAGNVMATMYSQGMGVSQSGLDAAKWYQSAAVGGHVGAQIQLASMYQAGNVIQRDLVRAYAWYHVASLLGAGEASINRDNLARYMDEDSLVRAKDFSSKAMQFLGSKVAPVPAIHSGGEVLQATDVRNMAQPLPPMAPAGSPPPPLAALKPSPGASSTAPPATIQAPMPVAKTIAPTTLAGPTTLAPPSIRLIMPLLQGGRDFNIPRLDLQMVWVDPGTFMMGDSIPVAQGLIGQPGRLPDRAGPGGGGPGKGGAGKRPGKKPSGKGKGKPGNIFDIPGQAKVDDPAGQDIDGPANDPVRVSRTKSNGADPHEVRITQGFWLGKFEITNTQYSMVTGVDVEGGRDWPVVNLSWQDAENFCNQLNQSFGTTSRLPQGWAFQLPTEAQWEYACRAGTATSFAFGDDLGADRANINASGSQRPNRGNAGSSLKNVGSYPANAWGFHDMHGNAMEYVNDWFGPYQTEVFGLADPRGPGEGTEKLARGGSWRSRAQSSQSFARNRVSGKDAADETCGFRVCLAVKVTLPTTPAP